MLKIAAKYNIAITEESELSIFTPLQISELKAEVASNGRDFIVYAWALVKKFHVAGFKQVIVSNGVRSYIEKEIKTAPFQDFDLILASCAFQPKPNAEMFHYAMKQFNIEPENALFIGDSETDQQAAWNAGIKFFKVNGLHDSYYEIAEYFNFL